MNFLKQVETNAEKRIDSYLASELSISRSKVQKLIKEGLVTVNGDIVSNNYVVKMGDQILVDDDLDYEIRVEAEDIDIKKA